MIGLAVYVALLVAAFAVLFARRGALAAAHRGRRVLRRARAAHVDLRRLPRGPDHVDAARASASRSRAGPGRADAAPGAGRSQ